MSVKITQGDGTASVAAEVISTLQYQQIKVVGGETGSTSVMGVNPDRSINVSVLGVPSFGVASGSVLAGVIAGSGASSDGTTQAYLYNPATGTTTAATLAAGNYVFNGSTWEMWRGNSSVGGRVTTANSSVITVVTGSVITVFQSPSIVGTYVEDAATATGDRGVFVLAARNDTLASVTSADLDYSGVAVGPVGEIISANAPITKWIQGTADLRVVLGSSVTAIAAQGASIFTYITGVQVANMGSASVLVTLAGGLGSILGYTIAPAGGGSNIIYPNALKTGENSAFTASISGTASVLVSAQGFISKT